MGSNNQKIALIPAYNPGDGLADLAAQLCEKEFDVIIVNDGSDAACYPCFLQAQDFARVLSHEQNKGKGAALKTGLAYIKEHVPPPYTVVTLDADGQHSVEDAERVCSAAMDEPESLILGSREMKGKIPARSRLGNGITRVVYRVFSGRTVRDTQTGLRAFSDTQMDRMLAIRGSRYEYEMNVLMKYARANLPIREVPIETIYLDGNASSHFRPVQDSYRVYKEILKFSASSLICFGIDYLLFCEFSAGGGSLVAANVAARVISATVNYQLNRKLVFGSDSPVHRSALQYFLLAVFVLICNTSILKGLVDGLHVVKYVAKIVTEISMFFFNWMVQRTLIFQKKGGKELG